MTLKAELGEMAQLVQGRDYFQNSMGGRLSKRRSGFPQALQHDSILRPNQCGSPLVGLDGKVVGINIARSSRVSSLALPVSTVQAVVKQLKEDLN